MLIRYNLDLMLKQTTFRFVFTIMLILSVALPIYYLLQFQGSYEYSLPSADTLFIGNSGGLIWQFLALVFPFIIALPYSFSFLNEQKSGVQMYVQSRKTRKEYYYGQLVTCFLGTALLFLIPFLLNILLNALAFPVNGNDYISTHDSFDSNWANAIMGDGFYRQTLYKGMMLKEVVIEYPQIYNVLYTFWISIVSGIMAMFTYTVSLILQKKAIYLLLVNYLIFSIFSVVDRIVETVSYVYVNINLTDYLSNGHFNKGIFLPVYILILVGELIASFSIIKHRVQEDEV